MPSPPDLSEAAALQRAGRLAEAEAACHAVLAGDISNAEAWRLLAAVAAARGDAYFAEAANRRALAAQPGSVDTLVAMAAALRQQNRAGEAEAALIQALQQAPRSAGLLAELADMRRERGSLGEAEALLRQALDIDIDYANAWNYLGMIRDAQEEPIAAEACYRRAVELNPRFAVALVNLGSVLMGREKFEEAIKQYDSAVALAPGLGAAHWNRAMALFMIGNYGPRAWSDYDWRWRVPELLRNAEVRILDRRWRGESVAGKTVLLHSEQGIGDTFQFARYVPLVAQRGARVVLAVQPATIPVLSQLPGIERIMSIADVLPPYDWNATLPDLPGLFGTTLDTVPARQGYLRADPPRAARWQARLAGEARPKIGLVWAGNPRHRQDRFRSIALGALAPLLERRDVAWFSLQVGERAADIAAAGLTGRIANLAPDLKDFADTAAALSALDLTICVDTAVLHLAGALGRPAWLMLPRVVDWRWMMERDDTPWYASVQLFRQSTQGDWAPVVVQIGAALQSVLASRGAAPRRLSGSSA